MVYAFAARQNPTQTVIVMPRQLCQDKMYRITDLTQNIIVDTRLGSEIMEKGIGFDFREAKGFWFYIEVVAESGAEN